MGQPAYILTEEERPIIRKAIDDPVSAMRKLLQDDLYLFLRYFWDCYTEAPFIGNWHLPYLAEELTQIAHRVGDRKPKLHDLVINIAPGTTKTALCSIFFPVWCWTNWYWMRFITSSHSDTLALESAEYSRDLVRNEKFKRLFPEIEIKQDKDQKSNFRIVKKEWRKTGYPPVLHQGGGRVSTTVTSKITGFHGDIIIADDLVDPNSAISKAKLKTANDHVDQTLSTRKTDKNVSTMIMIGQRLAQNDPPGHLLAKNKTKMKHISIPGEIRDYEEHLKPAYLKKYYIDNLMDPKRMSWEVLKEMEADLGQYGYAGQIGQNPIPAGGGMFETDKLIIVDSIPSPIKKEVRYWDKAGSIEETSARTAGVNMALLNDGRFIVKDVKKGRWKSHTREEIIKTVTQADGYKVRVGVEQEPGSGGKESVENTIRNLAGYSVTKDRPTGDKALRADPFSVQVNSGNVLLLRGDWNREYIDELSNFPLATFKDQVDASSGAFAMLTDRILKKATTMKRKR